jgi:hypothetical protein
MALTSFGEVVKIICWKDLIYVDISAFQNHRSYDIRYIKKNQVITKNLFFHHFGTRVPLLGIPDYCGKIIAASTFR